MATPEPVARDSAAAPATIRSVILASSLGTLFEWYDFYLYGTLAVFFGQLFFPSRQRACGAAGQPGHVRRRVRSAASRGRWCSAAWATSSGASTPS
jgi:hypothetical protein